MPIVLNADQSSTGLFDLLHDSYNAYPTFALIDHTMRVRAKPWNLDNNSNSNSCDGSNSSISGWSGGSASDFIGQLVEECGSLCVDGGCSLSSGDVNEDEIVNIQDIITMVNHILGSSLVDGCALEVADMNTDGIINIQDLISLVNSILGIGRIADINGYADVNYISSGSDLIIRIESTVDLAGVQLSIDSDSKLQVELKDNSHISEDSHFTNGITRYLAYSIFNQPFDGYYTEFLLHSASKYDMNDIQLTLVDINGDVITASHVQGIENYQAGPNKFELSKLYPNPFNPSTEVRFTLPVSDHVRLSAYDVRGQEVDVIFEGAQSIGIHSYTWNAAHLPSGVYYVRLQASDMITSQKALLVK